MTSLPVRATVYIVRHGQTAANARRYVGWEDEPLDEVGRKQAESLACLLAGRRIEKIVTSPLRRARDTAAPLARLRQLPIDIQPALIELHFGLLQGRPKSAQAIRVRKDHLRVPIPGGESLADVARRASLLVDELKPDLKAGRSIALFSHFWTCRMLLASLLGLQLDRVFDTLDYKPQNASVLEVGCVVGDDGLIRTCERHMLKPDMSSSEGAS